jgi:hypothetical protein
MSFKRRRVRSGRQRCLEQVPDARPSYQPALLMLDAPQRMTHTRHLQNQHDKQQENSRVEGGCKRSCLRTGNDNRITGKDRRGERLLDSSGNLHFAFVGHVRHCCSCLFFGSRDDSESRFTVRRVSGCEPHGDHADGQRSGEEPSNYDCGADAAKLPRFGSYQSHIWLMRAARASSEFPHASNTLRRSRTSSRSSRRCKMIVCVSSVSSCADNILDARSLLGLRLRPPQRMLLCFRGQQYCRVCRSGNRVGTVDPPISDSEQQYHDANHPVSQEPDRSCGLPGLYGIVDWADLEKQVAEYRRALRR